MLKLTHTVESVRGMLLDQCRKGPQTSIEELIRTAADYADKDKILTKDSPISACFAALAKTPDSLVLPAMLGMRAGDMAGPVEPSENEAKALAAAIIAKLSETGKRMTKTDMAAAVLPGVDLAVSPQHAADFTAALKILVGDKNVIRRTSKGEIAEKRWDTMEYVAPAKVDAKATGKK